MSDSDEVFGNLPEERDKDSEKYLIFSILNKLYSFPSSVIGEIVMFDTVYPLPLMPPFILGVINRYSIPYALFDTGLLFHNTSSPRRKVLVVKDTVDRVAFLIDDVNGIADVRRGDLLEVEKSADSTDLTETICASFNWNDDGVFVLDIRKILEHVTREIG
jgi:purine-binding chemotaxis protein CheW